MPFESPNARSKSITVADGPNTGGALNQHPAYSTSFAIGVAEDKGSRRTMEDSHSFVVDFDDIRGQGYFGLFDGHAGKHAAEWCGQHFHEYLLENLHANPTAPIPSVLNSTFHAVDTQLSRMASEQKTHSGCTAVAAFLRIEDANAHTQTFVPTPNSSNSLDEPNISPNESISQRPSIDEQQQPPSSPKQQVADSDSIPSGRTTPSSSGRTRIRDTIRSFTNRLSTSSGPGSNGGSRGATRRSSNKPPPFEPNWASGDAPLKKVLYAANAGDARAVLCRNGNALRLTYDHKGSDALESKRITDAGGFVMNNRVNGVLAVTRALGDSSMKEFVVGAPYTTETELTDEDEFLILACDGLWDVADDQEAVDLVRNIPDAQSMSKKLLQHALDKFSSDNVTVIVVRFNGNGGSNGDSILNTGTATSSPVQTKSNLSRSGSSIKVTNGKT